MDALSQALHWSQRVEMDPSHRALAICLALCQALSQVLELTVTLRRQGG